MLAAVYDIDEAEEKHRLQVSKSGEVGKGRVVCKSVKSAIITVSAQKATSQLAEMVLIILTQSAPRHGACVYVRARARVYVFEDEKAGRGVQKQCTLVLYCTTHVCIWVSSRRWQKQS